MLRSYDYIEIPLEKDSLQKSSHSMLERKLALDAVDNIKTYTPNKIVCPACNSEDNTIFFTKWTKEYFKCNNCESIFLPVEQEIVEQFNHYSDLYNLRVSDEYQKSIFDHRELSWLELLSWIKYRTYRYKNCNTNLSVCNINNRYFELDNLIKHDSIAGTYNSIDYFKNTTTSSFDVVICLNKIQQISNPIEFLNGISKFISKDGLLFLGVRLGTGYDVLLLKENSTIYPYEYIFMPSKEAITKLLMENGYEVLEYSTPGLMDIVYIKENIDKIADTNYFIKHLIKYGTKNNLGEFQRFLQKSQMSSLAHIIARKI